MIHERDFYGSAEAAQKLGIELHSLQVWIHRHPEYRPNRRINKDDLIWSVEDIERVKVARAAKAKHGNRNGNRSKGKQAKTTP